MNMPPLQVRRATVDDLPKLTPLWREENLPVDDLDKRFKEFQLVEGANGELLGALGLQIAGHEGHLHSEVFPRPELADAAREKLWERAQIIANNHGLVRMWTQLETPFWHANGFGLASGEVMTKLPATWRDELHESQRPWRVVQLREDKAGPVISIDKEFAMFKEAERERTERMYRQARFLKVIAILIAGTVLVLMAFLAFKFFRFRSSRM